MGHESQIEPWLAPDNRVLLVGLRTDWLRRKEAMKTAGRETHNRYATVAATEHAGAEAQNNPAQSRGLGSKKTSGQQVKCFFLTSPFIVTME